MQIQNNKTEEYNKMLIDLTLQLEMPVNKKESFIDYTRRTMAKDSRLTIRKHIASRLMDSNLYQTQDLQKQKTQTLGTA